jgi:cysteine desulfurase family protein (TIGR01976 family)
MQTLDTAFVRKQFPPLANGWAFFENAGGSYVPQSVIDRVHGYMSELQLQPSWTFGPSAEAIARIAEGKRLMAAMIGAEADEVIIGHSTTMNVYLLTQGLRPSLRPGDEIVVTNLDHEANVGAWRRLAEFGVVIREWQIDPVTGFLDPNKLDELIGPRTRLVAMSHCSNIVGSFNDVAAIAEKVHSIGALLSVDGVAAAPHRAIDVKALDVDFYAFSLYKTFGPHLALLYAKRELWKDLVPQNHFFVEDSTLKLLPGGSNHELTAGLVGTADYFDLLDRHHFQGPENEFHGRVARVYRLIEAHERRLGERVLAYLRARPGIRIIGQHSMSEGSSGRAPTISFTVAGRRSQDVAEALNRERIAIGFGDFYARRCVEALGLNPDDGVVRVGIAHYNDDGDIDRLLAALDKVL